MHRFSILFNLYFTLILVIGTAFLSPGSWIYLSIFFLVAIFYYIFLGIPFFKFNKILLLQFIFLFFIVVQIGWEKGLFIIFRSMVCLLILNSFLLTLPSHSLIVALSGLAIPKPLKQNLLLTVHYLEILFDELEKMKRSAALRGINGVTAWLRYINAAMVGSLYIRTLERSEKLNQAMYLRGFQGSIPMNSYLYSKERVSLQVFVVIISIFTCSSYIF